MTASTLTSGTKAVPYMPMTIEAIPCPAPVLAEDLDDCFIPGGYDLWASGGFYSPGQCFVGYQAACTQTAAATDGWPIRDGETAVRCIPTGCECNDDTKDQKYATTIFDGTVLSVPAFEIRWRTQDIQSDTRYPPPPGPQTLPPPLSPPATSIIVSLPSGTVDAGPDTSGPSPSPSSNTQLAPHSTISPGGIAGIVVGGGISVIGMLLAVMFFIIRRSRKQAGAARLAEMSAEDGKFIEGQPPIELDNKPMQPKELCAESATGAGIRHPKNVDCGPVPRGPGPNVTHISLNEIPIEMPAEPVERPPVSGRANAQGFSADKLADSRI